MSLYPGAQGANILRDLVATIQRNAAYLSELDGAVGDGDHGVNMSKGFGMALQRLNADADVSGVLDTLGNTLLGEIGGAMGPLYGTFFLDMAAACRGKADIDAATFGAMLRAGLDGVQDLGGAAAGDKTLLDTLIPAQAQYAAALAEGVPFAEALKRMAMAAEAGRDATLDMVAKIGRASRLGERSRGHVDAGAASCFLILGSMAATLVGGLTG
jgi:dihydroxyacetone kinase-like protein